MPSPYIKSLNATSTMKYKSNRDIDNNLTSTITFNLTQVGGDGGSPTKLQNIEGDAMRKARQKSMTSRDIVSMSKKE